MKTFKPALYLLLIFFAINTSVAFSQEDDPQMVELKKKFESADEKNLTAADKVYKEAEALTAEAKKMDEQANGFRTQANSGSSKDKKKYLKEAEKLESKSVKKKIKASAKYAESNKVVYNVYKKYLKKFAAKAEEAKKKQSEELEVESDGYFKDAKAKRQKSVSINNDKDAYKLMGDADLLEANSIAVQIQAFSILLNWFSYDDNKVKDITDNTNKEKYDEYKPENNTTKVNETNENTEKDNSKNNVNNDDDNNSLSKNKKGLIFKVQIAASKVPLSIEKLRTIYPSNEIINNEKDGEWYKYSVGYFSSYEKAFEYKQKTGVRGAFIIAYRDGVKIKDITEVATTANFTNNTTNNSNQNQNVNNQKTNNVKLDNNAQSTGTEYRVQIGSTKNAATEEEIKIMNPTKMPVKTIQSNGWYKYTIGTFATTEAAQKFLTQNNISPARAYIVKYVNGQEVEK